MCIRDRSRAPSSENDSTARDTRRFTRRTARSTRATSETALVAETVATVTNRAREIIIIIDVYSRADARAPSRHARVIDRARIRAPPRARRRRRASSAADDDD